MRKIKKLILLQLIVLLTFSSPVYSTGFIFHWKAFVVDYDLLLIAPDKINYAGKQPVPVLQIPVSEEYMDRFGLSASVEEQPQKETGKNSVLRNIKVRFKATDLPENSKNETLYNRNDEQISKFVDAVSSLIYDDSKFESLETIGKIIEPQINFFFEF